MQQAVGELKGLSLSVCRDIQNYNSSNVVRRGVQLHVGARCDRSADRLVGGCLSERVGNHLTQTLAVFVDGLFGRVAALGWCRARRGGLNSCARGCQLAERGRGGVAPCRGGHRCCGHSSSVVAYGKRCLDAASRKYLSPTFCSFFIITANSATYLWYGLLLCYNYY